MIRRKKWLRGKKRSYLGLAITILLVTLAISMPAGMVPAQPEKAAAMKQQANADLDNLAKELAKLCSQPGFRGFLRSEIKKSRNRENIIELDKFLDRAAKQKDIPPGLKKFKDSALKAKARLKTLGPAILEGYDLYIPVDAHKKKWQGGKDFVVAYSPVDNEDKVKEIVAYSVRDGKRVILDPVKTPQTVVLVIAPEEHTDHKLYPPVETYSKPIKEKPEPGKLEPIRKEFTF